jgi:hypothetical protein
MVRPPIPFPQLLPVPLQPVPMEDISMECTNPFNTTWIAEPDLEITDFMLLTELLLEDLTCWVQPQTPDKTTVELKTDSNALRREIIILIGIHLHGSMLLF